MIDLHPPRGAAARSPSLLTVALLAAAAGAALLVRGVSSAEPLGIDQSLWASAVRGMARGQLLYQDVWEQRPPGIYFVYLAGFQLLGWAASTIAWLDVLAATAITILLYVLGRTLAGPSSGAAAAALYAVLTMPAGLYGHGGFLERSVCETFIGASVALGAWCAVRFRARPSFAPAFGVGLCSGAAIVLKPNAGLYLPALLLWIVLYGPAGAGIARASLARLLAAAALGTALIPAVTIFWLWRLGLLQEAAVAVIDFNRFYVAQGFTFGGYAVDFSKAVWLRMKTNALWAAGGIGAAVALWELARTRRLPPMPGLAVVWGAAAALVIVVNGARLFNSYFIQALPPLALLAAWLLTEAVRGSRPRRLLGGVTAVLMLAALMNGQYAAKVLAWGRADFDVLRGRIDRTTYLERFGGYASRRGYSARANAELAQYVREHTAPDDEIFLFGINGAGVYFAADRLTAHRFLRVNFFVATDFPDPRFRLDAVLGDLAAARPRYVIFERLHSPSEMGRAVDSLPTEPAVRALLASYDLDAHIEDFTLYRRRD